MRDLLQLVPAILRFPIRTYHAIHGLEIKARHIRGRLRSLRNAIKFQYLLPSCKQSLKSEMDLSEAQQMNSRRQHEPSSLSSSL
jgi:hypothetical protein